PAVLLALLRVGRVAGNRRAAGRERCEREAGDEGGDLDEGHLVGLLGRGWRREPRSAPAEPVGREPHWSRRAAARLAAVSRHPLLGGSDAAHSALSPSGASLRARKEVK